MQFLPRPLTLTLMLAFSALLLAPGSAQPQTSEDHSLPGQTTREFLPVEALFKGVASNRPHQVRTALDQGADVNFPDSNGYTPLIHAALLGHSNVVETLLSANADPNIVAADGMSALLASVMTGDRIMTATLLLPAGADPDLRVNGTPRPLMVAVMTGQDPIVKYMLDAGAEPGALEGEDASPAMVAHAMGHHEIVELLGGLPLDATSITAYHDAIVEIDIPRIKQYRDVFGLNEKGPSGMSALELAILTGSPIGATTVINGADVLEVLVPEQRDVLLEYAAVSARNDVRILEMILSPKGSRMGSHSQALSSKGYLLGMAIKAGNDRIAKWLINHLPREELMAFVRDNDVFLWAALNDSTTVVNALINNGIWPALESDTDKPTPHDVARAKSHYRLLNLLPDDRGPYLQRLHAKWNDSDQKAFQQRLKQWGYYLGSIDGIIGEGTLNAFRGFLRDRMAEAKVVLGKSAGYGRFHRVFSRNPGNSGHWAYSKSEEGWEWLLFTRKDTNSGRNCTQFYYTRHLGHGKENIFFRPSDEMCAPEGNYMTLKSWQ